MPAIEHTPRVPSGRLGRLCLVTDHRTGTAGVLDTVAAGLAGGVDLVQVRPGPDAGDREAYELALQVLRLCRARGVPCLVDDRVDVALAAGADGAHVGAGDLPVRRVRELLGPGAVLGATARDPGTALRAQADGATYVGVGPAFDTRTKEGLPPPLGAAGVGTVARALDVPVLAIGAVTVERVPRLLAAGAHGIAVVSALSRADDPRAAASALRGAIDRCPRPAGAPEGGGPGRRSGSPERGVTGKGTMTVTVNGSPRELPRGASVAAAVESLLSGRSDAGVAVAIGGEVVARERWGRRALEEGESLEVIMALQGG